MSHQPEADGAAYGGWTERPAMAPDMRSGLRWGWGIGSGSAAVAIALVCLAGGAHAADANSAQGGSWAASWTAAMQAAFPAPGAPAALIPPGTFQLTSYFPQPDNLRLALPNGTANDQTFRMMVRPDLWDATIRVRFSNVFGKHEMKLDAASAGLQEYSASVIPGTTVKVTFNGGQPGVAIAPGAEVFSDPVQLPFVTDADKKLLPGRNLAVSFAVQGSADMLSYHYTAFTTSYLSAQRSGDHTRDDSGDAFPYSTMSWFVVDAVDVMAPAGTAVVCAYGDSITDGTHSTMNGNDRYPDALALRLHERYGDKVSVVNESITGNAVVSDALGPPATQRLDRDVLGVSGLSSVIWLEGINDLGSAKNTPDPVIAGYKDVVARLHKAGIIVIGATLTPSYRPDQNFSTSPLGTVYGPLYGSARTNDERKKINDFIRGSGLFDAVVDMDAATADPATGVMRAEFVPDSNAGPGDYLHPNRAGYQAMADAVDLTIMAPGRHR